MTGATVGWAERHPRVWAGLMAAHIVISLVALLLVLGPAIVLIDQFPSVATLWFGAALVAATFNIARSFTLARTPRRRDAWTVAIVAAAALSSFAVLTMFGWWGGST